MSVQSYEASIQNNYDGSVNPGISVPLDLGTPVSAPKPITTKPAPSSNSVLWIVLLILALFMIK
jgi:hypothetical protein